MGNDLITKDHEQVIAFFTSVKQMEESISKLSEMYKPVFNGERYLTDQEVSEKLKISRRSLQDYRSNKKIPYFHFGGKVLYKESDIEKLLEQGYCNNTQ